MDCGNDYIKMCDCKELQNAWFVRQGGIPDLAFIKVGGHYKRSIISRGLIKSQENTSHFEWSDYSVTNPQYFNAISGVIGRRTIVDGSTGENFIDLDETFPVTRQLLLESFEDISNERWYRIEDCIWLPRQDQLQEMVEGTIYEKLGKLYREIVAMDFYPCDSAEQLWLAFVMREKYGKVWDGEKWVNEDTKG